jgi:hypothetical protein
MPVVTIYINSEVYKKCNYARRRNKSKFVSKALDVYSDFEKAEKLKGD